MELLAAKVIATSVLIAAATLTARRWGETVGGMFAGLPLTSGPVSLALAVERGPDFAAAAAHATILGLVAVAAYALAYLRICRATDWRVASLAGVAVFVSAAFILSLVPVVGLPLAIIGAVASLIAALALAGDSDSSESPVPAPRWDLPARMIVASAIVLLITGLAERIGAEWTGLLSPFPVFSCVMGAFCHHHGGAPAARRLLRGVLLGTLGFAAFFLVVALLITRENLHITYLLACAAALGLNGLLLPLFTSAGSFRMRR